MFYRLVFRRNPSFRDVICVGGLYDQHIQATQITCFFPFIGREMNELGGTFIFVYDLFLRVHVIGSG